MITARFKNRSTLKQTVERHPLATIAATVVATATAVGASTQYLASQRVSILVQKHELQVQELQGELASIHRGLGQNEYLDVRSFIHDSTQQSNVRVPLGSRFFESENFYAADDSAVWKHEETSEAKISETLEGQPLPATWTKPLEGLSSTVHMWRDPAFSANKNDPSFTSLGSFITLQKVPIGNFTAIVSRALKADSHGDEVALGEIFLTTEHKSTAEIELVRQKAQLIHDRAQRGEDFAELARQLSESSTANQGGEIGVFERGDLSDDVADVVFKMKGGEISDVLRVGNGYAILKVLYHSAREQVRPSEAEESNSASFLSSLDAKFRGDITGTLLIQQLKWLDEIDDPDFGSEIVRLQKIGNVVYVQFLKTARNITVGGRHYPRYFVRQELILISDSESVYIIQSFVPTADPSTRGEVYSRITDWFSKLAVFAH